MCRSVSSEPTTTSKNCSSGRYEKASRTVSRRFAVTTAEPPALLLQRRQHVGHAGALGQLGVQRLVVLAVAGDELVDAVGVDQAHLLDQARAADGAPELLVRDLAAEHGLRRVAHRRDDDRAGVDHGAVEVEEDDREAHGSG